MQAQPSPQPALHHFIMQADALFGLIGTHSKCAGATLQARGGGDGPGGSVETPAIHARSCLHRGGWGAAQPWSSRSRPRPGSLTPHTPFLLPDHAVRS